MTPISLSPSSLREGRWYEYIVRFVLGGAATVFTGFVGSRYGPAIGGLFLALPAIFCASATLVEKHEIRRKHEAGLAGERRGQEAAALDAAGAALGALGMLAFAIVFSWTVSSSIPTAFVGASLAWLGVSVAAWFVRRKLRSARQVHGPEKEKASGPTNSNRQASRSVARRTYGGLVDCPAASRGIPSDVDAGAGNDWEGTMSFAADYSKVPIKEILMDLNGKKIAILATNGFEQAELEVPRDRLKTAGATVDIISLASGEIRGWNKKDWGRPVKVDKTLDEVSAQDYAAVVLPGGQINPDLLRVEPKALKFIKDIFDAKKVVAAVCHAPWLLIETGIAKGRKMTSFKSIKTDVANAGGKWEDSEVVVDQGVITSRNPGDLEAFSAKIIEEVKEGRHIRRSAA